MSPKEEILVARVADKILKKECLLFVQKTRGVEFHFGFTFPPDEI